ncbi:ESX secretion-associated protein EspG [Amycolatopsis taiwanensis]|uniref:ESX secretion-associated protein EspG n=1 Tax=Amycolatopsis taiwanensis TaxID=342230 RepID=A0A9W6VEA5_9PSEU|nr:ESX secretion-associated protein EspG [Amycolatopsis taiwanensis]GLY64297.1 ESX secretion-associated protein EspG [Amycolatopsis taiwanensis]
MNTVVLPRYAFIRAWELAGYGKPHPVVGVDDLWLNDVAKTMMQREVDRLLDQAGVGVNGVPTPEFRRKLAVLARAEREYCGWISRQGETGAALVAAIGGEAVRVVRDDKVVVVDSVRADDLAGALVDALPNVDSAEIGEISAPVSRYTEQPGPEEYEFEMDTRDQPPDPAALVRAVMNAPRAGMHQLSAARRDRNGQRRRGRPITVIDLAEGGRILTYVVQPPNGEPVLRCVPGTRHALLTVLARPDR